MYFLSRSYDKQVSTFKTDNCAIKENPIQRKMSVASENVEQIFEISRLKNFWINKTLRNYSGHKSTDLKWSNWKCISQKTTFLLGIQGMLHT
jgi:hypothetical protein